MVVWGEWRVDVLVLKLGDTDAAADPVPPKEGPMGPHVEHLVGADKDPIGITNYDLSEWLQAVTEGWLSTVVVVVVVMMAHWICT